MAPSKNQPYRRSAYWFKPARKAQDRFPYHFAPPLFKGSTRDLNLYCRQYAQDLLSKPSPRIPGNLTVK